MISVFHFVIETGIVICCIAELKMVKLIVARRHSEDVIATLPFIPFTKAKETAKQSIARHHFLVLIHELLHEILSGWLTFSVFGCSGGIKNLVVRNIVESWGDSTTIVD